VPDNHGAVVPLERDLPDVRPYFVACAHEQLHHEGEVAVRIGRGDPDGEILLLASGEVVDYRYGHTQLMNSSLEAFGASLLLMRSALQERDAFVAGSTSLEVEAAARELGHKLRRVDPMAWDTPGGTF
jgi:hypothetical protein